MPNIYWYMDILCSTNINKLVELIINANLYSLQAVTVYSISTTDSLFRLQMDQSNILLNDLWKMYHTINGDMLIYFDKIWCVFQCKVIEYFRIHKQETLKKEMFDLLLNYQPINIKNSALVHSNRKD
eukprot:396486_1